MTADQTVVLRRPEPSIRRRRAKTLGLQIGAGILIALLWQIMADLLAPAHVARPSNVIAVFPAVLTDPAFGSALASTVGAVLLGLAIGATLGVVVGLAMGRLRIVERTLKFYVQALFTLPIVALLPLIIMWFGYSDTTRLFIIVIGCFLPVAMNMFDGSRATPREFLEVARSYRAPWWREWIGVSLPSALAYLLSGIRLAAGRALVGAVVSEFMLGIDGLGYYILSNSLSFRQNEATVAVLFLTALGVLLNFTLEFAVRRFLGWYRREG